MVFATLITNFETNLSQKKVSQYNLPKGKIQLIKSESKTIFSKARNVLNLKGDRVLEKDYNGFRKTILSKYPKFIIIADDIEKEINPKKAIKTVGAEYHRKKNISDSKDLQVYFTTLALEIFIRKNNRLPSSKKDFEAFSKIISKDTLQKFSQSTFNNMEKSMQSLVKKLQLDRSWFNKRLLKTWGEPLSLFQALLHTSYESAYYFRGGIPSKVKSSDKHKAEALLKIHARALRISNEIFVLLCNGFPDGANSRWRSLYELAVISFFISQNNDEVAQRYLEHEAIDKLNRAESYQKHHKKLGYPPIKRDLNKLRKIQRNLCAKYGNYFKNDHGWIPKRLWSNQDGIGFSFIEESVKLSHLNPFYKLSSSQVHGGSGGFYSLGLINQDEFLLIGSSNYGLADPLQNASISIHQITVNLLNLSPDFEGVVSMFVMHFFVDKIALSAIKVQKEIEKREKSLKLH
ncbi:MAG: DUF5677 domain-containing protein [Thermodesulfobacteriota bacterium]